MIKNSNGYIYAMYTSYITYNLELFFYAKMHVLLVHVTFIINFKWKKGNAEVNIITINHNAFVAYE
jgi:hypothetical protein